MPLVSKREGTGRKLVMTEVATIAEEPPKMADVPDPFRPNMDKLPNFAKRKHPLRIIFVDSHPQPKNSSCSTIWCKKYSGMRTARPSGSRVAVV